MDVAVIRAGSTPVQTNTQSQKSIETTPEGVVGREQNPKVRDFEYVTGRA